MLLHLLVSTNLTSLLRLLHSSTVLQLRLPHISSGEYLLPLPVSSDSPINYCIYPSRILLLSGKHSNSKVCLCPGYRLFDRPWSGSSCTIPPPPRQALVRLSPRPLFRISADCLRSAEELRLSNDFLIPVFYCWHPLVAWIYKALALYAGPLLVHLAALSSAPGSRDTVVFAVALSHAGLAIVVIRPIASLFRLSVKLNPRCAGFHSFIQPSTPLWL